MSTTGTAAWPASGELLSRVLAKIICCGSKDLGSVLTRDLLVVALPDLPSRLPRFFVKKARPSVSVIVIIRAIVDAVASPNCGLCSTYIFSFGAQSNPQGRRCIIPILWKGKLRPREVFVCTLLLSGGAVSTRALFSPHPFLLRPH